VGDAKLALGEAAADFAAAEQSPADAQAVPQADSRATLEALLALAPPLGDHLEDA
jgi:hypothetical protein